jgi:hypothetical protein
MFTPQQIEDKPELYARLLADFVLRAYRVWLGGDEVWPELENEVAGKFEEIMRAEREAVEASEMIYQGKRAPTYLLTLEQPQLCLELLLVLQQALPLKSSLMPRQPPLERLRKEETNLKGDQAKFLNWIKIHEEKSKKMEDGNGKLREALRMEGEISVLFETVAILTEYSQMRKSKCLS